MTTWARDYVRVHYRPMAPRPDAVFTCCTDIPEAPRPVDPGVFLDALAASFVPEPNRSWEQALRWRHGDLPNLDGPELWRERERATFLAVWLPGGEARDWAERRLRAVAGEQARRKRAGDGA